MTVTLRAALPSCAMKMRINPRIAAKGHPSNGGNHNKAMHTSGTIRIFCILGGTGVCAHDNVHALNTAIKRCAGFSPR